VRSSLTDTSYFPTEDLNDVPEQPSPSASGDGTAQGANDLIWLGYTFRRYEGAPSHSAW